MARKKTAPIITIVGGGSPKWSPNLLNDILLVDALDGAEVRLFDLDLKAAERMKALFDMVAKKYGRKTRFTVTGREETAYRGTQFVIITINTGGLEAGRNDLEIPEKYGILQTVGDTVGPGGWNRAIRNIPVFVRIAKQVEKYSDDAVIINYSNPMAILTQTLSENCSLRVTGLCHGILGAMDLFRSVFGVDKSKVKVTFGGTNHFWFVTDVRIEGKPGYPMLKECLGKKTFADYMQTAKIDGFELHKDMYVVSDLYHQYGYIAYPGDRHICEFVSGYLNAGAKRLKEYHLERTTTDERIAGHKKAIERVEKWISGELDWDRGPSGETAAEIIKTVHTDGNLVDDFNLVNRGQIPNLPLGAVVETLGMVSTLGFIPGTHGPLPAPIATLTMPHCVGQQLVLKAVTACDKDAAYQALSVDPLCSHLSTRDKRRLYGDLWRSNRSWLPENLK
jgi:alpha-galactosidase